jgi:putative ATPase
VSKTPFSAILMPMELFSQNRNIAHSPLAYRMRPRNLDEFIGQSHIVGPGRLLRRVIQADRLSSLVFYGPPGCGKTTLARVIAGTTKSAFDTLNAVLSGVKDLRESLAAAQQRKELYDKRTILFIDEVHRWNKAQQDALLPSVENGTVILIGATTENPFFEVNSALVSRSRIFQLKPLEQEDLFAVAAQTLADKERGYGLWKVEFEEGALEHLIDVASGDARSLLNALELAVETSSDPFPPPEGSRLVITMEAAEESIQQKVVLYDKEGDYHFDVISAFIKSIRGSDPDAALYWLAKMVRAGEDPRFILRRMLISAGEDIGLADPAALGVVSAAAAAFDRVGMPEGRFHLTQAALYLATAPKSNSALAFFDALKAVEEDAKAEVPNHLRDGNRDEEGFGHGEGYLYPHAYRDHWVAQHYLPESMRGRLFYQPSQQGYEKNIREEVQLRREAQLALGFQRESGEILTFGYADKGEARWLARLSGNASANLKEIRDALFTAAAPSRHDRILDLSAEDGLLLWEACRRVPEGGVWALTSGDDAAQRLEGYSEFLQQDKRPFLLRGRIKDLKALLPPDLAFEGIMGRNLFVRASGEERKEALKEIALHLAPEGRLVLAETVPRRGMRLSQAAEQLISGPVPEELARLIGQLKKAEEKIYEAGAAAASAWDLPDLLEALHAAGLHPGEPQLLELREERVVTEKELSRWLAPETRGGYGEYLREDDSSLPGKAEALLQALFAEKPVGWKRTVTIVSAALQKK